ncbi:hypothetical protein [Candidatus Poriferisocius sp.]|uniref:hypothetical protein n=1 Tax=Candidatus Poriferisocius sp. TaxID=3101276 RepID=UPI003B01740B
MSEPLSKPSNSKPSNVVSEPSNSKPSNVVSEPSNSKPSNVVVVLLDSLNRHMLGSYGGTEFETPNLGVGDG